MYQELFESLLTTPEQINDIETASIWLASLNLLFSQSCVRLFPRTNREQLGAEIIQSILERLQRKVLRQAWLLTATIAIVVGSFAILIVIITTKHGWDFAEPRTYLIVVLFGFFSWLYLAITGQELSPQAFYDAILRFRRGRVYKAYGIDEKAIELFQGID